ncbi:exocyst complex component EXO70B1-like [Camellia sinensis]|uniref:Exocyst subunit Exo70 family protein n=1 Tax=Camellia sinensis var. sinensis TaxID=542762 RepID=A0A4S4E726_CAMSN|nr:exocyst complex component EXO70B1-like [Camellia sinensis]THG11205.1 hypothetical protein TEA_030188 [Camellia sinensis var. sinensis]
MEKNYSSEKSGSFITGRHGRRKSEIPSPRTPDLHFIEERWDGGDTAWRDINVEEVENHNVDQVSKDIDRFTNTLSAVNDKSSPPEVPDTIEIFSKILESRIVRYYSANSPKKFGKMMEDDSFFLEAVRRISKLTTAFGDFPSTSITTLSLNRISMVLQRAMSFLEEEFRYLLENSRNYSDSHSNSNSKVLRAKQSSFNSNSNSNSNSSKQEDSDRCGVPDSDSNAGEQAFPAYSPEAVNRMSTIASAMILAGYETECYQVFNIARRNLFNEAMKNLDFDTISIEDVQRMQWELLEGEIGTWIKVVKQCATVLFPGERKLCDSVFSDNPSISAIIFSNLARSVVIQLLTFADAMVLTRRSAEKLFKYLDMYEALRDLIPAINESCSKDSGCELSSEISAAANRIGEAAVYIFCDLENSIKGDASKTPVPGGAVHPLTRYVMNYLKYTCEYKDTLEQIFKKNKTLVRTVSLAKSDGPKDKQSSTNNNQTAGNESSPFAVQLMTVVELLDENLDAKSKLYKDPSLRYVFLMNNGRYILQKIKGSSEILELVGDTWYRMRSTVVRQYHKNYQRETWGKVLHCLGHEGLQVNSGKVQKQVLKERFKNFSMLFDEIHKTQSTWVVSDDQLQSELRVSVSAVVIPAYRSFLGRFRHYLDSGRPEKYIKYQPEDVETLIEGLFDGNSSSMGRKRT